MDRIVRQRRLIFAVSVIAFRVLHFIWANFGEAVAPVIPWPPGYPWAAYLMGFVLLATGVSIAIAVRAREAAALLGVTLLLSVFILHVPRMLAHPLDLGLRTRGFEPVVFGIDHFLLLDFISKLVPTWNSRWPILGRSNGRGFHRDGRACGWGSCSPCGFSYYTAHARILERCS